VLSELPDLWKQHLSRWSQLNRNKRQQVEDAPAPDREDEYLLYQTLAGLWSPELPTEQLIELMDQSQRCLRNRRQRVHRAVAQQSGA
jgi:maltooligosyltrehalose synthase